MIAFSTTDRDSFEAVEKWKSKVEAEVGSIAMVMVQNKVDLIDKAVSSKEEVPRFLFVFLRSVHHSCAFSCSAVARTPPLLLARPCVRSGGNHGAP